VDNKVLMTESRTLFIEASTPEPDENSQVLNQIEFTRCTAETRSKLAFFTFVKIFLLSHF
jgi:hypothetical protein